MSLVQASQMRSRLLFLKEAELTELSNEVQIPLNYTQKLYLVE